MERLIEVPAGIAQRRRDRHRDRRRTRRRGLLPLPPVHATELARHAGFEDVWYLFERGALPDDAERRRFAAELAIARRVPEHLDRLIGVVAQTPGTPLGRLRTVLSAAAQLIGASPDARYRRRHSGPTRRAAVAALVPGILARLHRSAEGVPAVDVDPSLGHAAAYLAELTGVTPPERHARALEQYLILTIDHGFNASTFTARVVASTGASIVDAVCAAIGALAGPLHGGAPSRALDALDAIGSPRSGRRLGATGGRCRAAHHGFRPCRLPRARPAFVAAA